MSPQSPPAPRDEADRPDYLTCVADHRRPRHAVCGRYVGAGFAFTGWDHAARSEAFGSRLTVCPACAAARPPSDPTDLPPGAVATPFAAFHNCVVRDNTDGVEIPPGQIATPPAT